jgi:hypothetical protein
LDLISHNFELAELGIAPRSTIGYNDGRSAELGLLWRNVANQKARVHWTLAFTENRKRD